MRRLLLIIGLFLAPGQMGCLGISAPRVNVIGTPGNPSDAKAETAIPDVVRAVSSDRPIDPDVATWSPPALAPPNPVVAVPGTMQFCPIDPVLKCLAGNGTPEVQQDALSALALMGATGSIQALRRAGGTSSAARGMHHLAGNVNDLLQPDDDTAANAKSRPPFFFTLGLNY